MAFQDILDLHSRLLNPRPFVQGEVRRFVKEFETKRSDREVEKVFQVLERVTELKDGQVEQLKAQCDSTIPTLNANLLVAQSMANKILEQSQGSEIEQALESSQHAREKEWNTFVSDIQDKFARIDDAYRQKEDDLIKQYIEREEELHKSVQEQS